MNPKQENLLRKIFLGSLVDKSIHLSKINMPSPSVLSQLEFKTDGSLTGSHSQRWPSRLPSYLARYPLILGGRRRSLGPNSVRGRWACGTDRARVLSARWDFK